MSIVGAITAVIFAAYDSIASKQAHFTSLTDLPVYEAVIIAACQQARLQPGIGDRSCSSKVGCPFRDQIRCWLLIAKGFGRRNV